MEKLPEAYGEHIIYFIKVLLHSVSISAILIKSFVLLYSGKVLRAMQNRNMNNCWNGMEREDVLLLRLTIVMCLKRHTAFTRKHPLDVFVV